MSTQFDNAIYLSLENGVNNTNYERAMSYTVQPIRRAGEIDGHFIFPLDVIYEKNII